MCAIRLKKEERKKMILDLAKEVFLKKGFKNTTMQDIIEITNLSTGGLYHYYKNTTEILYEIMVGGNLHRENLVYEKLEHTIITNKVIAEVIVDKMLGDNEYIPLYIMFLQQLKEDESLNQLFETIKSDTATQFRSLLTKYDSKMTISDESFEFITYMINAVLLGCELINARAIFTQNKEKLIVMIECYLGTLNNKE